MDMCSEYIIAFVTFIASVITIVGFVYAFLRNFKTDVNSHLDKLEKKIDSLEERMFYMATGKSLSQAILEEKMKKSEGK